MLARPSLRPARNSNGRISARVEYSVDKDADVPHRPRLGHRKAPLPRILAAAAAILLLPGLAACGPDNGSAANAQPVITATSTSSPSEEATEKQDPVPDEVPAPAEAEETTDAPAPEAAKGTALAQLESIPIKGRAPKTGYDRDLFGNGWKDPDRNGCDARNDMLNRDLTDTAHKPGTQGCVVTSGTLADPFTATTIGFVRGNTTSTAVQIDHVVPLSDAWQKGAQQLAPNQREAFANDPLNLLATDGPTNAAKGDSDAATWLPPNKAFRCEYVALQTAVKAKHKLWMTQAEHNAIRNILETSCPGQPVPEDKGGVNVPVAAARAPAPKPKPAAPAEVAPVPAPAPDAGVFYQNCSAVRAAGADPIRVGDPGWEAKIDRDGDGVGCE